MISLIRERHWTDLVERSLQVDTWAYRMLLVELTVGLRNVIRRRARSAGVDAQDVVEEVRIALHLKRGTWAPGTPLAPWGAAIARNKIVDALRAVSIEGHSAQEGAVRLQMSEGAVRVTIVDRGRGGATCPGDSRWFVATWYSIAIVLGSSMAACVGRRLLRW